MNTDTAPRPTMASATSGDDILTVLYGTDPATWEAQLAGVRSLPLLRAAADLCGVDSEGMTRRQATRAIVTSF